jgi:septal ring factor EnvC (AmiA/AmiB activator)
VNVKYLSGMLILVQQWISHEGKKRRKIMGSEYEALQRKLALLIHQRDILNYEIKQINNKLDKLIARGEDIACNVKREG